MKPFLKKYLFCLRWGLQVLSCFGQNLQPSTLPLENIYVISVIIYSTLLFVFLIGNMQTYLQSASERPEDIVNNMKMEERLKKLKKVEELGKWEDAKLESLCTRMKPAFYGDRTLVIREGEPISEILFVLRGKLWTYTSSRADIGDNNGENVRLREGAIIGKELVSWIQAQPNSSILPISTRTIRTLRHVESIAITAYDLKDVSINKPKPPEIRPRSLLKKCNLTGFFRSRNRENL
ncbi:cyclic nucleotide-gated ion channel 1-like [Mangifera indica]|uniref:cyclic nucleotide-gated ion channel 1-like n=1 Tax=Mangifera indica TaxID=29780 RepID=UPI001CFAA438|nr:cyclic nucleotide-gated ion channel 1-like [Mangifera indica]